MGERAQCVSQHCDRHYTDQCPSSVMYAKMHKIKIQCITNIEKTVQEFGGDDCMRASLVVSASLPDHIMLSVGLRELVGSKLHITAKKSCRNC